MCESFGRVVRFLPSQFGGFFCANVMVGAFVCVALDWLCLLALEDG
jgi:hypothetical protein